MVIDLTTERGARVSKRHLDQGADAETDGDPDPEPERPRRRFEFFGND
ncbi:MAG: hypothetical protein ACE367_18240 [Acidimicrobiales bacterium]